MNNNSRRRISYYFYLLVPWTILIVLSVMWNLYQNHKSTLEKSRIEARTIFEHNLAYRKWNTMHGGVYAFVTKKNEPNPYLVTPERDLITEDGRRLTMINPFRMTAQAYDVLEQQSETPTINRTVSLMPLNPQNMPDDWEKKALLAFEGGATEVSEVTTIRDIPYTRVMKPYVVVPGCLKCHGSHGYKVGDIRGGMSIAVPLIPYFTSEEKTSKIIIFTHLLLWLIGSFGIVIFAAVRQKQENRIAESESKFRTLSEFSQDWEFWINEDMKIVYISPSCKTITGYSQDEFMNDPNLLCNVIHPEDQFFCKTHLQEFVAPQHHEMEFRIVTKDGQVKWLSHVCGPIFLRGKFRGRRISNRDITDRKRMEEQLSQSQKMESLGLLAGGIVHDFNNFLTVIKGFASLVQEELRDNNGEAREYVQNILDSADMAKNLTSSLLVFSRKQIVQPDFVSLSGVLRKISPLLRRIIGEDIELRITYADLEYPVLADPHQIEQVLMNLITNAKDALAGGGSLSISTSFAELDESTTKSAARPGKFMVLSVSDTGSGIDANDLPHIFEPFFTTKGKSKGTGLGLSMVYEIVREHNGFVDVQSQKDVGTTFEIYFPAFEDQNINDKGPESRLDKVDLRGTGTVLLVEDDENVRKLIHEALSRNGYKMVLASDGADAMRKFGENRDRIDLVILDVVLPKKNGKEVYDEIKAEVPDIKFLFVSGYAQDILTTKGIHQEGLEFIAKPIDISELLSKIKLLITGAKPDKA